MGSEIRNRFKTKLFRLLLTQSGVLRADEELTPDPQVPASVGDILRSEKYWKTKINSLDEKWKKPTEIKTFTKP